MILSVRRLALPGDDRPGDPHCREPAIQVEILEADRKNFADTCRGAEDDFDDLPELTVGPRSRQYSAGLPRLDRRSDLLHLFDRERVRDALLPVEPGDVVHRVAGQDLVADRECEGEAKDDAGMLGAAVAAFREMLEEVVAAGDTELSEGEVSERWEDEGAHVSLV